MRLFLQYVSMHLKTQMQHKISFFLVTLGQFLSAGTTFLGIRFLFLRFNNVEGFTYREVLLCYAIVMLAFSIAELFGNGLSNFAGMLGDGTFDRALVRPQNVVAQIALGKIDLARIGLFLQALPVFLYAAASGAVQWTPGRVLTVTLMLLSGGAVFFALFLINATLSFFTVEGLEVVNIFTYGGREFGKYPFAVYGKGILRLLTYCIPLALFQYYPLLYLLGRADSPFHRFSPLLALLFLLPACLFFRFGLRHYKSTGS